MHAVADKDTLKAMIDERYAHAIAVLPPRTQYQEEH